MVATIYFVLVVIFLFVSLIVFLSKSGGTAEKKGLAASNNTPNPNGMVAKVTSLRNLILMSDDMYSRHSFNRQLAALRKGQFQFHSFAFEMMQQLTPQEAKYLEQLLKSPQEKEVLGEFLIQYKRWLESK